MYKVSNIGYIVFVSAHGGNILDLLNRRRQAQCPGWTFEKDRALCMFLRVVVAVVVVVVVVVILCLFVFVRLFSGIRGPAKCLEAKGSMGTAPKT